MPSSLSDEQWRNILDLAHAAADLPQRNRRAFVESHSSSPDIAREVLALVAEFEMSSDSADIVGTEIGHFVLKRQIGSGGMGDVYLAQDTELGRTVAVKLLNPHALALGDAQERFIREARTASALNHPNIVTIHEIVRSQPRIAIIMELVEGISLRQLSGEAQTITKVVSYGQQMADALAAAHAAGVIHRDIKPENVMLRSDGRIKLLDFGLARSFSALSDTTNSSPGLPAGTWRYMSPEQFKGLPLTGATDVFTLGMVLHELLTGRYPFPEGSPFDILQSIATRETEPPSNWNSAVSPTLDALVRAMLDKDPARRPTAQAVSEALADLDVQLRAPLRDPQTAKTWNKWRLGAAIGFATIAAGATWYYLRNHDPWRFEQLTTLVPENRATAAAISPDGKFVAYANGDGVFKRAEDTGEATPLPSPSDFVVDHLAWFADGTKIAASGFSVSGHNPAVWILSATGSPVRMFQEDAAQAAPSPDGKQIAFLSSDLASIWVMPTDGGEARPVLTAPTGDTFVNVAWIAGGKHLVCQRRRYSGKQDLGFVMLDRYYERNFESVDVNTGRVVASLPDLWIDSAASLPDGRVLFLKLTKPGIDLSNQVWQVRVDPISGKFHGALEKVADPLRTETGRLSQLSASADGREIVVIRFHGENAVFVADFHSSPVRFANTKRLTLDERSSYPHAWTRDSKSVIFESDRHGSWDLFKQSIDQRIAQLIVGIPTRAEVLPQLSLDGKSILYAEAPQDKMRPYRVMRISLDGGASEQVPTGGALDEFRCSLGPSGRCVVRTTIDRNYYVYSELDPTQGIGRELARTVWIPSVTLDWDLSPDGRFVAFPNHDWQTAKIRIVDLTPKPGDRKGRELDLPNLRNLNGLTWSADGNGWFVSVNTTVGKRLLFVDLNGAMLPLGDIQGWAVPSPDGKKVAYLNNIVATNAWRIRRQ